MIFCQVLQYNLKWMLPTSCVRYLNYSENWFCSYFALPSLGKHKTEFQKDFKITH